MRLLCGVVLGVVWMGTVVMCIVTMGVVVRRCKYNALRMRSVVDVTVLDEAIVYEGAGAAADVPCADAAAG